MKDSGKPARGLEEVFHFFLSRQSPPDEAKKNIPRDFRTDAAQGVYLSDNTPYLSLLFSANNFFAEQPFLACNLALELARKNFSVVLIEASTTVPNTLFLLRSLFPASIAENASPTTDKFPTSSAMLPLPELPKIIDISIGGGKKIKGVFWEKGFDSEGCRAFLKRMSSGAHFLIINEPSDICELKESFPFMNTFFIVPATVDSDALLESYAMIKRIHEAATCPEVGLLIIEESCCHKAEAAFNVVATMVNKFLSSDIHFMGTIPRGTDLARPILTRTPLLLEAGNSPVFQSMRKLADNMIKKYFHLKEAGNG